MMIEGCPMQKLRNTFNLRMNKSEIKDWFYHKIDYTLYLIDIKIIRWKPIWTVKTGIQIAYDWIRVTFFTFKQCVECGIVLHPVGISKDGLCHTCDGLNYYPY